MKTPEQLAKEFRGITRSPDGNGYVEWNDIDSAVRADRASIATRVRQMRDDLHLGEKKYDAIRKKLEDFANEIERE